MHEEMTMTDTAPTKTQLDHPVAAAMVAIDRPQPSTVGTHQEGRCWLLRGLRRHYRTLRWTESARSRDGAPRSDAARMTSTQDERLSPAICTNLLTSGHMRECSNYLGVVLRFEHAP